MRIVTPEHVTEDVLQSTSVVNIESDWEAGTYSQGDRRVYDRRVYEVVASSTDDRPDIGAAKETPSWSLLGWSNQWRMFTEGVDSLSTAEGEIDVTLQWPALVTTVAALGLQGNSVKLTMTDAEEGVVFEQELSLVDIGVSDWWEWFFLPYDNVDAAVFDVPPYPGADIHLLVEGAGESDPVAVGRVVAGVSRDIGATLFGTSIDLQDYSIKERDGFGSLRLVQRRAVNMVNYEVHVDTDLVDATIRNLKRLAAQPTLYIGDPNRTSTVTFGVFADVSQGLDFPSISELTLQVEEF